MNADYRTMIVQRIDNQGDRVLLYDHTDQRKAIHEYYVIAKSTCTIKVGDTIKYEPYGFNFGWHIAEENTDDSTTRR